MGYYYLRLYDVTTYLPLEEYVGKTGIIRFQGRDALLTFDNRDDAGEYLDTHRQEYPDWVLQICFHLENDGASRSGTINR